MWNLVSTAKDKGSTDDKLSEETTNLIVKREAHPKVENMTPTQRVEWSEIQKASMERIKSDCKKFESRKIQEIWE